MRLNCAEMFAQDADPVQIARSLRVSTKSVYQWRRAWRAGGQEALASKGPGGSPRRLDEGQREHHDQGGFRAGFATSKPYSKHRSLRW